MLSRVLPRAWVGPARIRAECVHMHVCAHARVCACASVCACVCAHACVHMRVCVCVVRRGQELPGDLSLSQLLVELPGSAPGLSIASPFELLLKGGMP